MTAANAKREQPPASNTYTLFSQTPWTVGIAKSTDGNSKYNVLWCFALIPFDKLPPWVKFTLNLTKTRNLVQTFIYVLCIGLSKCKFFYYTIGR